MKILSLHTEHTAVGNYRTLIPAKHLERRGHTVLRLTNGLPENAAAVGLYTEGCVGTDLIVCGRACSIPTITSLVTMRKQAGVPLVMDFDDHFMGVTKFNEAARWFHQSGRSSTYGKVQLIASDAATTTTEYMKQMYSKYKDPLLVLPNCVDPELWEGHRVDPERKDDSSIRIVFAGGSAHYGDLLECREAIERIMEEFPQVRLFFMGCFPDWAVKWCREKRDASKNRAFSIFWAPFK
ncbi:hypothetical protein LCGC14_2250000, partial [marine sediment metagenome]